MGTVILFVVLVCTVKQILLKIDFSVMVSLIEVFWVQSHAPDPIGTFFLMMGICPISKLWPFLLR